MNPSWKREERATIVTWSRDGIGQGPQRTKNDKLTPLVESNLKRTHAITTRFPNQRLPARKTHVPTIGMAFIYLWRGCTL